MYNGRKQQVQDPNEFYPRDPASFNSKVTPSFGLAIVAKSLPENSLLPKNRPVTSASAQQSRGLLSSTSLRGASLDAAAARISHGAEMRAILALAFLIASLAGAVPEVKY